VLGTRRAQVKKLVDSAYERASGILRRNEAELHTLAQALLDKETLSGTQACRPAAARYWRQSCCAVENMSEQRVERRAWCAPAGVRLKGFARGAPYLS